MIKNNRLETIVSKLDGVNTLVDIGCDHGLVIKSAIDQGIIKNAVAIDLNIKPLEVAKNNLKDYPVKFVLSDGFKNLEDKFDGVVISGMGSQLISHILSNNPNTKDTKYILQANNKNEFLRSFLVNNNYKIIDEQIVFDKHYYVIITAIHGKQELTTEELLLGPILMHKKSSLEYYMSYLNKYNKILDEQGTVSPLIRKKISVLSTIVEKLS